MKKIQHVAQYSLSKIWEYQHNIQLFFNPPPWQKRVATVAINLFPANGPWGGASVFIWQFTALLQRCGIGVRFDLKQPVDLIFIIDPREDLQQTAFGLREIHRYKQKNPEVKIIHRINECDQRKSTAFMDLILCEGNQLADYTIFISEWLKKYFIERWYDAKRSHCVIYNGADERFFHPIGGRVWSGQGPLRLVTHHWSDNPMKGFPTYQLVDELIAAGELQNIELWVIGRWPRDIQWKSARTFPPAEGKKLATLLRQCHIYLTASLWEPCGMHHVEGAQCGLPLLSHIHGGGIVEAARRYGLVFNEDSLFEVIEHSREMYGELREMTLKQGPSGGRMAAAYVKAVQTVLAS